MSCWTFLEGDQNWSETQWKGLFPLCSTKEASRRARNKLLLLSFVFVCWVAERFKLRKVFASCSYGGQSKFMLAANFSLIFIINIIHVPEDLLLSPLQQPRIALIKILINYIFQSVIIFQMWILMNFASSLPPPPLAVRHHWQAPQNITNSTSESLPSNILGWKKKLLFCCVSVRGNFSSLPRIFIRSLSCWDGPVLRLPVTRNILPGAQTFGLRARALRVRLNVSSDSERDSQKSYWSVCFHHTDVANTVLFFFSLFSMDEAAKSSRDDPVLIYSSTYRPSQQCSIWTCKYRF